MPNKQSRLFTHSNVFRRAPGEFPVGIYCPMGICNETFPEVTWLGPTPALLLVTLLSLENEYR